MTRRKEQEEDAVGKRRQDMDIQFNSSIAYLDLPFSGMLGGLEEKKRHKGGERRREERKKLDKALKKSIQFSVGEGGWWPVGYLLYLSK